MIRLKLWRAAHIRRRDDDAAEGVLADTAGIQKAVEGTPAKASAASDDIRTPQVTRWHWMRNAGMPGSLQLSHLRCRCGWWVCAIWPVGSLVPRLRPDLAWHPASGLRRA